MSDFWNKNGLVDGRIPAGKPCPFVKECGRPTQYCPTKENIKDNPFSCAFARGWSLVKEGKDD